MVKEHWRLMSSTCVFVCLLVVATPLWADVVVPSDRVVNRVVVRERANSDSQEVGSLSPGDQAEYLGSVPYWYHIRLTDGTEGFVPKRWTDVVSEAAPVAFTLDAVDVGTGLAILVRGSDFSLLYDGGSNDDLARGDQNRLLAYLRAVAPNLTTIDHLILSHPHRDHVELLPDILANYTVHHVWDSGAVNTICGYRAFLTAASNEPGVRYHTAVQDFGTRDVSFGQQTCYGQPLNAEVIHIPSASRIGQIPVTLGQGATLTFLYADGSTHSSVNENSLVARLDLGSTRVLLMGDAEAGGRHEPTDPPAPSSIEGTLLDCCAADLNAHVLVVGHHGSKTSSRTVFLNAVGAQTFIVSSGPKKYGSVVLPDKVIIDELEPRGQVFRTDLNDNNCGQNNAKIGPDADGEPGGCDNVRMAISAGSAPTTAYFRTSD